MAPRVGTFAGVDGAAAERGADAPREADELTGRVEETLETAAADWSFVDAADVSVEREFFETPAAAGEVVERYWLSPPFAWGELQFDAEASAHRYHVREPAVDEFERYVREDVREALRSELRGVSFERSAAGRDRFDDCLDGVLADDVEERNEIRREQRYGMQPYFVVVGLSVLVFTGIVLLFEWQFLPAIAQASNGAASVGATRLQFQAAAPSRYRRLFYHAALVQAAGNGLLVGELLDGRVATGVLYAAGLVGVVAVAFLAATVL
ncbi:hypothetical protein ACFQJD_17860 [Haloplanus sp. GCM10025708]|uniref:hypothetical protein n=1 Tax=Haloferacaceae TaxID=1644056 RepID=UPI003617D64C